MRTQFIKWISLVLAGSFAPVVVNAYELATHGALTQKAYERSVLVKDEQLLEDLGIEDGPTVFGEFYYDVSGAEVKERRQNAFENKIIKGDLGVEELSLAGWLLRGAIREDDLGEILGVPVGGDPHDDPYGNIFRVYNHFFDPVLDRPLTTVAGVLGEKAPDWGLGSQNAFANPPPPNSGRRNHFTVLDAREAMYRALTGRSKEGTEVAKTKEDRNKYWATTFRALGDIVHLVEDMAQPQHTRNDPHSGVPGFGHASIYEAYVECRATGGLMESVLNPASAAGAKAKDCAPLIYNDSNNPYPLPRFTKYADFFSTRSPQGQGLADYSNRGFFSAGTNLGSPEGKQYPAPSQDPNAYQHEPVALTTVDQGYETILAPLSILKGGVPDTLSGQSAPDVPLTTEGLWYQPLADFSTPANAETYGYTLTRPNYDAQAALLIPRAVAYSAGLIDYFFRGRLEAEDAGFADGGVALRVKNAIDLEKHPHLKDENLTSGAKLVVAYEYRLPSGQTPDGSEPKVGSSDTVTLLEDIKPGLSSNRLYYFVLPEIPDNAIDLKFRLVYRGKLGQEDDAVVAGGFEPISGFVVTPGYTPADGIAGPRLVYKAWGKWRLSKKSGVAAGNIDWKGRHVDGKPTKVLSWIGPQARYFPDDQWCQMYSTRVGYRCKWISSSMSEREIYENGGVLARAPANVLGAAVVRGDKGHDWLVAICLQGTADVVYRRPYKRSISDALYDPVNAPDGWRKIGHFDPTDFDQNISRITHNADIPWFFDGSGRRAQTMRRWWDTSNNDITERLMRLEIMLTDDLGQARIQKHDDNDSGFVVSRTCSENYDADGAGSATKAWQRSGQYVIAVDYQDTQPVFGTIQQSSSGSASSSVSVTKTDGRVTSLTGRTDDSSTYHELLSWSGPDLTVVFDQGKTAAAWSSGDGQPSIYDRNEEETFKEMEISYHLDLRHGLHSFYEWSWKKDETIHKSGATTNATGVGVYDEKHRILSGFPSREISPYQNSSTYSFNPSAYEIRELHCSSYDNHPPTSSYGYNFGWIWDRLVGGWAVDTDNNLLLSQRIYATGGYDYVGAFHHLTGTSLVDLIPGASGEAEYYPVGVVR